MTNIGTNLAGVAPYSTQSPFLNIFKQARPWFASTATQYNAYIVLNIDNRGWVKSLPTGVTASTEIFFGIPNQYPAGDYVVEYDGKGELEYGNVVWHKDKSRPGRHLITLNFKDGLYLGITKTDPNNHIRNIRIRPAKSNPSQFWNPAFLNRNRHYKTLRFMDWQITNNSTREFFAGQPIRIADAATYTNCGVPWEAIVSLCNQLKANPWICLPHKANDEYVYRFARYFAENLAPSLKVYVEYSNEVWNGQFEQHHYAQDKAIEKRDVGHLNYMRYYGHRAAQVVNICKLVFWQHFGTSDRVIGVFATQAGGVGIEKEGLWNQSVINPVGMDPFDAYAIAPYIGNELGNPDNAERVKAWLKEPDGGISKAFRQLTHGDVLGKPEESRCLQTILSEVSYHADAAKKYGMELIAYEGGLHATGYWGAENDDDLTKLLFAVNRHPQVQSLYAALLKGWADLGGGLFCHYSDIAPASKWGCWGALESLRQNPKHAPKYWALTQA